MADLDRSDGFKVAHAHVGLQLVDPRYGKRKMKRPDPYSQGYNDGLAYYTKTLYLMELFNEVKV